MIERRFWLKSVGSSDVQQADVWPDTEPQELSCVHFPKTGRPGVRPGDYLVYLATANKRILGIAEVFTPPTKDSGEARWPWRCDVRPRIIINRVHRSPMLAVMNGPERDFNHSVNQRSHTEITEEQYQRALHALEDTFDETLGDRLSDWPMFITRLH